jgi:hypothetical protein
MCEPTANQLEEQFCGPGWQLPEVKQSFNFVFRPNENNFIKRCKN